ncbi:DNA polymerase III subunit delta [Spiroplasma endosymbiont of Amphibalanus improvisus]|uniref:DNA polymerase III subunit delta n=1 Tax=Spiroplasma endosymbiont of Amphibalanus improvisus TaxID=3066327 RepID=UPI00313A996E
MIHFIASQDNFLLNKHLSKMINKETDLEEYIFNADQFDAVIINASTKSMFGEKRNILIKDFNFLNEKNYIKDSPLIGLLTKLLNNQQLENEIIFTSNQSISSRLKLTKLFKENSKFYEIENVNKNKLLEYVKTIVKEQQLEISLEAIEYMLLYIPNDLLTIENELLKLKSFNSVVERNTLENNLFKKLEGNIFDLFNFLISNRPEQFMSTYYTLKENNVDIHFMISVLAKNVTLIKHMKVLQQNHTSYSEMLNCVKINPYQFKMLFSQLNQAEVKTINRWLVVLYEIDKLLKTSNNDIISSEVKIVFLLSKLFF